MSSKGENVYILLSAIFLPKVVAKADNEFSPKFGAKITANQTNPKIFLKKIRKKIWWIQKSYLPLQRQKQKATARWCNWQHV